MSRASFYQYFSSIDDCFSNPSSPRPAAGASHQTRSAGPAEPRDGRTRGVAQTATEHPNIAQLLMREGIGAGAGAFEEQEWLIEAIAGAITASRSSTRVVLPLEIMISGIFRFLSLRLDGAGPLDRLGHDVLEWAGRRYTAKGEDLERRFRTAAAGTRRTRRESPRVPVSPRRELAPASGTSGPPRRRFATWATAMWELEEVCAAADVSRRNFYDNFATKADAFIATYEYAFEQP